MLSRHSQEDVARLANWLADIRKEHAMDVEALDAVLYALSSGINMEQAIWYATCEWDL